MLKGFKTCFNYQQYLVFAKAFCGNDKPFENLQQWNDFFIANIETDLDNGEFLTSIDDYNNRLRLSPNDDDFPVVVYYCFDTKSDRSGTIVTQFWDWESFNRLNKNYIS